MATDNECLDYARECVQLAGIANDPELRQHLIQLAREWMVLAAKEVKATDWQAPTPLAEAALAFKAAHTVAASSSATPRPRPWPTRVR